MRLMTLTWKRNHEDQQTYRPVRILKVSTSILALFKPTTSIFLASCPNIEIVVIIYFS